MTHAALVSGSARLGCRIVGGITSSGPVINEGRRLVTVPSESESVGGTCGAACGLHFRHSAARMQTRIGTQHSRRRSSAALESLLHYERVDYSCNPVRSSLISIKSLPQSHVSGRSFMLS